MYFFFPLNAKTKNSFLYLLQIPSATHTFYKNKASKQLLSHCFLYLFMKTVSHSDHLIRHQKQLRDINQSVLQKNKEIDIIPYCCFITNRITNRVKMKQSTHKRYRKSLLLQTTPFQCEFSQDQNYTML